LIAAPAFLKTEAGEAAAFRQLARGTIGGHVEVAFVVDDFARFGSSAVPCHSMHVNR